VTARTPCDVAGQAASTTVIVELDAAITHCRACPRLVEWRETVAEQKRAAYRHEEYWGRPVPGFGPVDARIVVLGLAPGAHGANRTGRVFTGDRSGDWLYAALHRAGLANQPTSVSVDDGLTLYDTRVLAAVRCAPPGNQPSVTERDTCAPWMDRELELLAPTMRVLVALGGFAWTAAWGWHARAGGVLPRPRPAFAHGARAVMGAVTLLGSYHVSQQNTNTGRLTEAMLDDVLAEAVSVARGAQGTMEA
jgi:uracil-DNA glycosylase family 4